MKHFPIFLKTWFRITALIWALLLNACGLDNTEELVGETRNDIGADTVVTSSFSGSVGDGPVVGATLKFYDKAGNLISTVSTDYTARYAAKIKAKRKAYPLTVEVEGGTDLVTGLVPDFRMTSCIVDPSSKTININPFTTMIVETARSMPGGLSEENIAAAEEIVEQKLNFGLDPRVIDSPITTKIDDSNIAVMTKSSEAMGEMVRRTRDRLMDLGGVDSGDAVVSALAGDIVDGELDGRGSRKANIRVATVAQLVSAQVVIEALRNELKVGGVIATDRIDDAIVATYSLQADSAMTDNVPVNAELLVQGRNNIRVAQNLAPNADLDSIAAILDSLRAGSLASEVETVLPSGSSEVMDHPISIAVAATDQQLDVATNGGGSDIPPESSAEPPTANNAPVLSGAPARSVDEGSTYYFEPTASDPDGDNLNFSIQNRPAWASFDTSTGQLEGTPASDAAAVYTDIRISVSDGTTIVNLAPFSVTVNSSAPQTGSATLSWVAPVARADGNPLALSEIAGYALHYGESAGDYPNSVLIDDGSSTSITIADLPFGTYYFVMTTKDTLGNESVFSELLSKVVN